MKQKRKFGRTLRWTSAFAFAVLAHLGLYWGVALTRDSDQVLRRRERQFTEIQYLDRETARRSNLIGQQMTLFDPRPLMLPTQWNVASAANLLGEGQEEAVIFPDFAPMFELEDGNYIDDFGNVAASYDELSLAQAEFGFPPFKELGRGVQEVDFTDDPGVSIRLIDAANGRELGRSSIYNEEVGDLLQEWPVWRPALFLATVADSFQVAGLQVLESSGFDGADRRLEALAYENFPRFGAVQDGVYLLELVP